jgi:hypothetical protein
VDDAPPAPLFDDASSPSGVDHSGLLDHHDGGVPAHHDPIAHAMGTSDAPPEDAHPVDSFAGLQVDDSLAVPDEADLDDGF